jgi:hypothetical protein
MKTPLGREQGFAVLVAMMSVLVISAGAVALVLATSIEASIAGHFRDAAAARHAADAAATRALVDLAAEPDWTAVLGGASRSSFFDGAPGPRALPDASAIDLSTLVHTWNCGKTAPCTDADMNQVTAERPWGANNPRWTVYACGPLAGLVGSSAVRDYVVVLVADDPSETDGDPLADAREPGGPGRGVILVRGEAFGPGGSHAVADWTVSRDEDRGAPLRVVSWRIQD